MVSDRQGLEPIALSCCARSRSAASQAKPAAAIARGWALVSGAVQYRVGYALGRSVRHLALHTEWAWPRRLWDRLWAWCERTEA
jgi:hypothetical protein